MTKEALASALNGVQYGKETTGKSFLEAKESGLVIVYGASDDLVEFSGAFDEECGAYGGTDVFILMKEGGEIEALEDEHDCECTYCGYEAKKKSAVKISAKFDHKGYTWFIETEIPHATFEVMEGDEKFCRGIVFNVDDLK